MRAVQPDGKVLVASGTRHPSFSGVLMTVWRMNANGSPDATFNGGGVVSITSLGTAVVPTQLAVRPDGRIVIGAAKLDLFNSTSDALIVQLTSQGALDTSLTVRARG